MHRFQVGEASGVEVRRNGPLAHQAIALAVTRSAGGEDGRLIRAAQSRETL
ncbi:hypothetical protein PC129_g2144 [Phytophthora cactorum]|uniref:Uncharacterized protein n=1 Tax=Phytophthora cactorum TaxID=29920 RepID=A0A8T1EN65_9STRA|nr:hypothetical protein Pcac1_g13575 [Phytophthora cactorum]KAG2840874.1 hypothetical protein PC112_g3609 [Phytophthora cactorum]KAG2842633.1 hypothetical protein PC111_g2628 [Phytophthora cactorum]KAG2867374.1 hypothetical protein PC113_g2017 [Phytophthora cactorum]KAG2924888.1 hypothetical protein PC114_g4356 [Phytophthora cactorum]